MLNTVTKKKYYEVIYFNNEHIVHQKFILKRFMLDFINTIDKNRIVKIRFVRELDLEEVE